MMKTRIVVSHEMLAFVGSGGLSSEDWPEEAVGLSYRSNQATFAWHPALSLDDNAADSDLVLIVAKPACARIFGPIPDDIGTWHMTTDMRAIVLAIMDGGRSGIAGETLRLAKSIELLCTTFEKFADESLICADGAGLLSAQESERIAAARRLIDERWNEKITLEVIARTCGINRAKLTRGFRSMFAMSVADAITDRRLVGAHQMLLATDLPVSSIGYRCGYLNNASFTRAFSRRFGQPPTQLRSARLAA